jgi:hypothetical protein
MSVEVSYWTGYREGIRIRWREANQKGELSPRAGELLQAYDRLLSTLLETIDTMQQKEEDVSEG